MIFRAVEDADLILKARKGDVDAFNLLVSRWDRRVYNYILRLVNNREDALDLSQDTFLKAYQNLKKLEDPSRFAPWIFRIAHNEAYSLLRKRRRRLGCGRLRRGRLRGRRLGCRRLRCRGLRGHRLLRNRRRARERHRQERGAARQEGGEAAKHARP